MIKLPLLFDLAQTLDCGQAFRWTELEANENSCIWEGIASGKYLKIEQTADSLLLDCTDDDYNSFWHSYFDLDEDYDSKRAYLSTLSPALKEATEFAPGIRLLRQDPWEALCSFIISQNNHIPRIKGIITRLCENFGESVANGLYSFPPAERLASLSIEELSPIRAGFRHRYILCAAQEVANGSIDLNKIARSPIDFGRSELMKICGVGPKVAECALLFGFHKTEAFPMDTWMKKAMATLFPDKSPSDFGADAGLAQQYIFHYSRMHPEVFADSKDEKKKKPAKN